MSTNMMVLLIIACVICIYVYSYFLHPGNVSIIQTSEQHFNPSALLDKQPLVIEDSTSEFIDRFKSMYTISREPTPVAMQWTKNKYKHLAIQATQSMQLLVCPAAVKRDTKAEGAPPASESSIIAFKMSPMQTVILPFHWSYYLPTTAATIVGVHDLITYFIP